MHPADHFLSTKIFRRSLRLLFAAALVARAVEGATIEGHVALPKTHTLPVMPQRYDIVTKDGVVATDPPLAVVYLEGAFPRPTAPLTVQVSQKDLTFVPSLLPVQVGTRVEFPNLDDTFHNVFSFSAAKRFDLGRYRPNEQPVPAQVFDAPGLITLRCEIHHQMRGLILVLETPHFVVTDADGNYRLTGLPAGRAVLKAWIDSKTTRTQTVDLVPDGTVHVDFP